MATIIIDSENAIEDLFSNPLPLVYITIPGFLNPREIMRLEYNSGTHRYTLTASAIANEYRDLWLEITNGSSFYIADDKDEMKATLLRLVRESEPARKSYGSIVDIDGGLNRGNKSKGRKSKKSRKNKSRRTKNRRNRKYKSKRYSISYI